MIKRIYVPMAYSEENAKEQLEYQKQKLIFKEKEVLHGTAYSLNNGTAFEIEIEYQEKICISKFINLYNNFPGGFAEVIFGEKGEEDGKAYVEITVIYKVYGLVYEFIYRFYKDNNSSYVLKVKDIEKLDRPILALNLCDYIRNSFSTEELDNIINYEPVYY